MFIDQDWLAKQEAINEQLRRRAERRSAASSLQRRGAVPTATRPAKGLVQRSLAAAGKVLTVGGYEDGTR